MTQATKLLVACLALALPLTAAAQSADAKYCNALADLYRKTVPKSETPDLEVPVLTLKTSSALAGMAGLARRMRDDRVSKAIGSHLGLAV
jgi:hypothetical protein